MGFFKQQAIEEEQKQEEQELVLKLKMSFPKLAFTIDQAYDHGELEKVINLIEALETDLEPV